MEGTGILKLLNEFLNDKKILKIEQFRRDELIIFCEGYKFFININKQGELDFSITEN